MTEQYLLKIEKQQEGYESSFYQTKFHTGSEMFWHKEIIDRGRKELSSMWEKLTFYKNKLTNKQVLDRSLTTKEVTDILVVGFSDKYMEIDIMNFLSEALAQDSNLFGDDFLDICEFAGAAVNKLVDTTLDILIYVKQPGREVEEKIISITGFKKPKRKLSSEQPTYMEHPEQDVWLL